MNLMLSTDWRIILAMLLCYRLTELLVYDEGPWGLFLRLRMALGVYDRAPNGAAPTRLGRMMGCPYCVGMYMALLSAVPVLVPGAVGDLVLVLGGIAGAQAVLQDHSGR